jgi:hypothetical protein
MNIVWAFNVWDWLVLDWLIFRGFLIGTVFSLIMGLIVATAAYFL